MKSITNIEISKYKLAMRLLSRLKDVQQLSWEITQFIKKFPLEEVQGNALDELIDQYYDFGISLMTTSQMFYEELPEKDEIKKNKLNNIDNESKGSTDKNLGG
jgi:flagellar basal body-associated protein FliL